MSSDDDEAVLQKHGERLRTSLARPLARARPGETGSRRQSREPQSQLSQTVAVSRQSKHSQPARKAQAAPSEDDSDNEASLLNKHSNKLLQAKVHTVFPCLILRETLTLIALVTCRLQPSLTELRRGKVDQLRCKQT